MNTEQAIEKLKELQDGCLLNIESWAVEPYIAAIKSAITALKEKAERENQKPCEYCDTNAYKYVYVSEAMEPRIFFDVCGANIRFFDEQYEGGFCDMFKIHYCPMCGRKLKGETK